MTLQRPNMPRPIATTSPGFTSSDPPTSLTLLLVKAAEGDTGAADEVVSRVYLEIKRLAYQHLAKERPGHTLQATALVNESLLRLIAPGGHLRYSSRAHFFHAAARAMRQILIEHARAKARRKRGRGWQRIPLEKLTGVADLKRAESDPLEILALDQAICRLEKESPEIGAVVRLRFFAGLTIEETAVAINVSASTVQRSWSFARVWLFREMSGARSDEPK
jgi:RNA polymerase sigma-70 factor, ECF subfamily